MKFTLLIIWLTLLFPTPLLAQENAPLGYQLQIEGGIGPATSDYFVRGMKKAQAAGVELVILKMDTPGGLDTSMRKINKAILASSVPVITYVAPDGARAASAGTYILYASHVAAMAPATNLGAATPVQMGGGLPGTGKEKEKDGDRNATSNKQAMSRKAVNDAKAYIRGLAQKRGRNVQWAESAVEKAESLSAQEALQLKVIDLIATDREDLLNQLSGYQVKVLGQERTLRTEGIQIKALQPDWRNRILNVISNPNIAYILLILGIYGLIFEFANPGFIVPGVVGAISLLLGLYALSVLPVNYAGVALLLLGIALMVAESFVASFGALGIGGVAAFVFGSLMLIDTEGIPGFAISKALIASFAVVSAAFFLLVIGMAIKARRRRVVSGSEEMIGAIGEALEDFTDHGNVFVHSEIWEAQSNTPVKKGQAIRITERNGLIITIEPIPQTPSKEG